MPAQCPRIPGAIPAQRRGRPEIARVRVVRDARATMRDAWIDRRNRRKKRRFRGFPTRS